MGKTLKQGHETEFLDRQVFAPGETILREGSDGYCAYVIATGSVEVVKKAGEGETALGTLSKGALFGEMALIDDTPHMATVRAVDWTVAITIRGDTFRKKIAEADPFIAKLLRILVGHARSATTQLVESDAS